MPTRRAIRKSLRRKFKIGDVVTWGNGFIAHRVIAVTSRCVIVDSTSSGIGKDHDGRRVMLIEFAPGSRSHRCPGPPRHSNLPPDVDHGPGSPFWRAQEVR